MKTDFEIAVIGGGPAGLTAAVYAARAGHSVTILEGAACGGQMLLAHEIENYPGFTKIAGYALADQMMEQANIFLFTSDRQEGWGAVVNESMNSGCALVSGNMPGSVPYLVRQGYNGYMYQDGDQQMLNSIMERLVRDPKQCEVLGRRAYRTIVDTWNAENAAASLMQLIYKLQGRRTADEKAAPAGGKSASLAPCAPAPLFSEYRKVRTAEFVPEETAAEK